LPTTRFTIDKISDPIRAGINPFISKPGTRDAAKSKRSAFKMKAKSPKVTIVAGSVNIKRIGLSVILMSASTTDTTKAVKKPEIKIPGTKAGRKKTAAAMRTSLRINFILFIFYEARI
jgi:hypothetical protein